MRAPRRGLNAAKAGRPCGLAAMSRSITSCVATWVGFTRTLGRLTHSGWG
jgi:hypothetical protein